MYGDGRIPYIDALFFASGAATQSGLNTIDVNKLALYQQVSIMLIACVCNPIFINTAVVFIRLYWFEKRFQHVIHEYQKKRRHTRAFSKHKLDTIPDSERGPRLLQTGVGNREIRVLRGSRGHAYGGYIENEFAFNDGQDRTGDGIRPRRRSSLGEHDQFVSNRSTPSNTASITSGVPHQIETTEQQETSFTSTELPSVLLSQGSGQRSATTVERPQRGAARIVQDTSDAEKLDGDYEPDTTTDGVDRLSSKSSGDLKHSHLPTQARPEHDLNQGHHVMIDITNRQQTKTKPSAYKRTRPLEADSPAPPDIEFRTQSRSGTFTSFLSRNEDSIDPVPYLSWTPTIGRNSNFVNLDEDQREELGGIEYRALKLLAIILVCFFVGFHLMGMICLVPWINRTSYRTVVQDVGVNPTWWGFFTAASLFNDLGFTLTPDSMISFQRAVFPLVLGIFLIVIGNTGFPCMLRFVIWVASKCVPKSSSVWEELRFLLDHPRRCFTLLFPSKANWVLFWILILLNGTDLLFFIVLDLSDPTVTSIPPGFRFLAGLFQAASTRTAGFAVVNLPELHPAVQVSYMVMMYISVFPIAMSVRRSNVYEERSLGVWSNGEPEDEQSNYLSHHLRRQLSFDLWFVFLGFFLIAIIEGSRLDDVNEYSYSLFAVLFEIISAYGTVGLSQGYPGTNTSFSGQFRPLSKLVIIAMQIRGRHRGLPYGLDRAILLPSESLHTKENEEATRRARYALDVDDTPIQTATGLSRNGTQPLRSHKRNSVSKPRQLKKTLAGAFRAGPRPQE